MSIALASSATTASCQDAPEQNLAGKVTDLVDEVVTPEVELQVPVKRSKILIMKQDIFRTAIADPSILDFVAFGTREVELIGKRSGTTTVTFWCGTEQAPELLSMLVTVVHDAESEDADRNEVARFARKINELFPNSRIQLILIGNKLIARGQAHDEAEAAKIQALLSASSGGGGAGGGAQTGTFSNARTGLLLPERPDLQSLQLVNLIHVPGVKQVMLKVRIAELKRSAGREIGTDLSELQFKEWLIAAGLGLGGTTTVGATGMFNDVDVSFAIKALESNGTAKILAEPNLVTLSGQSATFLAGGEFAVPTVVGVGGAQAASTTFKGFGTQLEFTPTVIDHDRIRLNVSPSFSTLNRENAVGGVFGTDVRSVTTTVEMREGQVLAIAGLLQEQQRGDEARLPVVGKVPGLNFITGARNIGRDETELLILVTPELVEPMNADQAPTLLPGMEVTEPNDLDFYIFGDIEGRPNCHHRSTVWPLYKSRLDRCYKNDAEKKSSGFFLNGLHGFSK